jgi:2-polyprenyl-3-methyl-5-hydroxy-6-metoxy-1,4-benzoquinol methylase
MEGDDSPGAKETASEDDFQDVDLRLYETSILDHQRALHKALISRARRFDRSGTWLDVGCGFGRLLEKVQQAGFEAYGVEASHTACLYARRKGLTIARGLYPEIIPPGSPFHVVSFLDVLEHMRDPVSVLRKTHGIMEPSGLLIVSVPDRTCLLYLLARGLYRLSGERIHFAYKRLWLSGLGLSHPHRFYFNKRSLVRLLNRCGFQAIVCFRQAIGSVKGAARRFRLKAKGRYHSALAGGPALAFIQLIDSALGHGGLLTVFARPRGSRFGDDSAATNSAQIPHNRVRRALGRRLGK